MASMDAQAIYDNFHTHASGTPCLSTAQETAQQLAAKYQDRAVSTQQLIDGVQSGWKGEAAEAAAQGLAPLAVNSLSTHQQLSTGQDIVSRQVDSFHTAVSEVQPVPPAPQMQNVIAAAVAGQDTTPMIDQMAKNYAVQASNVDAYSKYVSAAQYNTTNVPPIIAVDTPSTPLSVAAPSAPSSSASSAGASQAPHVANKPGSTSFVRSGSGGSPTSGGRPSSLPPAAGSGTAPPPMGSNGNGSTTTSSASPPTVRAPSQSPGQVPPSGAGGNVPPNTSQTGPIVPIGDGNGLPNDGEGIGIGSGLRNGTGAPGDSGGEFGGIRSGGGNSSAGGLAPGTKAGGGVGGDEEGVGSRSGATPGSAGPAEDDALAAEQGAAARGTTSTAAGPMGAGRSGRGGDDTEHKRKHGVEEDGESLFGLSDRLAPPVLGETPSEREQRHTDEAGRHRAES